MGLTTKGVKAVQSLDLMTITESIGLTLAERSYFQDGFMDRPMYMVNTKKLRIQLNLKRTLPFSVYRSFCDGISLSTQCSVDVIVSSKKCDLSIKEIQSYISFITNEVKNLVWVNSVLSTAGEGTLKFMSTDVNETRKLESIVDELSERLNRFGITYPIILETRAVSEYNVEDVIRPKESAQNNHPADFQPRRRKNIKLEDYTQVAIKNVQEGAEQIRVKGKIFFIESQLLRSSGALKQTVYVHDEDDAICFTRFANDEEEQKKFNELSIGETVEVFGGARYDKYSRDLVINVRDVMVITDWMARKDTSSEKRIEFHLHTKMSEMDGVSTIEEYVRQAFEWGHSGLAITDHMSVQAFPKAQSEVKKCLKQYPGRSFKMIYGVEMNLVDPLLKIVSKDDQRLLRDMEYVVFDLETTGLSSRYDWIIEFGAVKIKQGVITERLQMFVKPPVQISAFTTEKTNIRQQDVDNAKSESELVDTWLDFFKDSVLVAHNAQFDIGFINAVLKRYDRPILTNTVLDTLDMSRAVLKERRGYRLGLIARGYKIAYDEEIAHRADYDAEVLSSVLMKLLNEKEVKHCLRIGDLQNLQDDDSFKKVMRKHVIVIAKNQTGLKRLFELVTLSHTDRLSYSGKSASKNEGEEVAAEPRILRDDLSIDRKDLLIGSSCFNGEIFELAANRSYDELRNAMAFYDYIEVQPPENYRPLIESNSVPSAERILMILNDIIKTAIELNLPVLATGDAHYLTLAQKKFRDVYIQAQGIGGVRHPLYIYNTQRRQMAQSPNQHFRTTDEMIDAFSFLDHDLARQLVIDNPVMLAEKIEQVYPVKDRLYTPTIEGAETNLSEICYYNAKRIYGDPLPEIVAKRLEKELHAIITNGFAVVYYIAHLLVKKSHEDGYMVGSRGSVGSSLVATMSNITEVNPLAPHYVCPTCQYSEFITDGSIGSGYDLPQATCPSCGSLLNGDGHDIPFETFLGFEGDKVPDIDLNFSGDYQEKAHAYTKVLFGDKNVYRAGTIGTVAQKTAFGYISGYLEELGLENNWKQAYRLYVATGCEGVKKTTGQHPGGIIVIPQGMDVHDFTPVQFPANNPNSEWLTTHFEFADIHDNVLKLDILGHVDPTAMKLYEKFSGIDVKTIPMNDPEVMKVFSSIEPLKLDPRHYSEKTGAAGLPEFGTSFVRQMLEITKPRNFSDLVRISGLSHGTDVWLNNAKNLVEGGATLQDVIGCRDDIMMYLEHKGLPPKKAFDIMESVRKGKGLKPDWKDLMKENSVPDWYIDSCLKIKYMFPKAHAVAYVQMAVRVAWFKVYHPEYYYAVYFTLRCNSYEIDTMIKGAETINHRMQDIAMRLNDQVQKKTVTKKEEDLVSTLEVAYEMCSRGLSFANINLYESEASEFIVHPEHRNVIIPPFTVLDGLGENVAKSVIEARRKAPFLSKEDLLERTLLNTTQLRKLEVMGVLKGLQEENQMSLF